MGDTGQRRRGWRTVTAEMVCPTTAGEIPRRVTSTSGSSGIFTIRWIKATAAVSACAGGGIYLR